MVIKEFTCSDEDCGAEFEALVPVCPYCGAAASRAFRTAPGVVTNKGRPTGKAKAMDKMLQREFDRQGISNFSNVGGENRISWARRVNQKFPGVYASDAQGIPQPPIRAYMGKANDFSSLRCPQHPGSSLANEYGFDPATLSQEGRPWNLRQVDSKAGNEFGTPDESAFKIREPGLPPALAERSEVLVDVRGDPEIPSGVDVNTPGWSPKNA